MKSHTRTGGTTVFTCETYDELIQAARKVVETSSYAKVNSILLDLTTASMLVQVRDKLNERNLTAVREAFTRLTKQAGELITKMPDGPLKKKALSPEHVATHKIIDLCWKAVAKQN